MTYYKKHRDKVLEKYKSREFKDTVVAKYLKSEKARAKYARYHASERGQAYLKAKWARHAHRRRNPGTEATLTAREWEQILVVYDHRCVYCGRRGLKLERDHRVPAVLGGPYNKSNILPACRSCNVKKRDRTDVHPILFPSV